MSKSAFTYVTLVSMAIAAMLVSACGGQIDQDTLGSRSPTPTGQPTPSDVTGTSTPQAIPTRTPLPGTNITPTPRGEDNFQPASGIRTPTPRPDVTPDDSGGEPTPTPSDGDTPTQTPGPGTPVATPTPIPTAIPTPVAYGPVSGEIEHLSDQNGDDAEQFFTGVEVQDFLVSAEFANPFPAERRDWNYGYWIRITERTGTFWTQGVPFPARIYSGIAIVMDSTGDWTLFHRQLTLATQGQSITDTPIDTGEIGIVDRSESGSNTVAIAAFGERGWLLVNGDLVAELDLSLATDEGEVRVITGVAEDDEFAGASTGFENLRVTEAEDGGSSTRSGILQPFAASGTTPDVAIEGDFIFETEISVPTPLFSGPWSWAIDVTDGARKVRLVVNSEQQVLLFIDEPGLGRVTTVNTVRTNIRLETDEPNSVQVSVIDGSLGIMVNGFPLPSVELDDDGEHTVTMMAYVQGEPGAEDRIINHDETRVWQVAE